MNGLKKREFLENSRVGSLLKKCYEAQAHTTSAQKEGRNFSKTRVLQSLALL